ncbi:MAG: transaldolase family protein [Clostridiales bacterium]|nr:transaldolase family protein [Clostridiales bacterium]
MSRSEDSQIIHCKLKTLLESKDIQQIHGDTPYLKRVYEHSIYYDAYLKLKNIINVAGVTSEFRAVVDLFKVPEGETPAGFRVEYLLEEENVLKVDLARDISYDRNGIKRPTNVLFSADSANPYEVEPVKNLIANLTCNPGIVYDMFINNPKANINNRFKTRDEVMVEIGRILGPGVDISVELNDPFNSSKEQILEEAAKFREMLTKYRVVIKVPHTGPVNAGNVNELLCNEKKFYRRCYEGSTNDMFYGHNLALLLKEHGFRVNFTLMFEPYQTMLALQAKPYFVNSFIRHRNFQSQNIKGLLSAYEISGNEAFLKQLRTYMIENDYFSVNDLNLDLNAVKETAKLLLEYRKIDNREGRDGLDGVRHNLKVLRSANLPDTRLIICSMEGPRNYPDIDRLLSEEEFRDMNDKVVITAEPSYLAMFTSCSQVISYQRRFMNAAKGQK